MLTCAAQLLVTFLLTDLVVGLGIIAYELLTTPTIGRR
jgi:hypothetical protein